MKKLVILACSMLCIFCGYSQNIDDIINDPNQHFADIVARAEAYYAEKGTVGTGWKQYQRWKAMVEQHIGPDGKVPNFEKRNAEAYHRFLKEYPPLTGQIAQQAGISNWVPYGQATPTIPSGFNQNGLGSVRTIEWFNNDLWVATPGGGIWRGAFLGGTSYSWSPINDGMPNLAVTDIAIAPTNVNTIYALTGAVGGARGYRSTGVIKSTDQGNSWYPTGLTFPENGNARGFKLLVNPNNENMVWAATSNGLFRTNNGGASWALVTFNNEGSATQNNLNTTTYDIVYRPGSTTVLYASGNNRFFVSTDGGLTFTRRTNATATLIDTGSHRVQIGVTPANNQVVYLLYGNLNNNDFEALFRSTDGGTSFSLRATTPNLLGSQSWRNIAITIDPTNANNLYVGGLDVFKSTNGGTNWTQISDWSTTDINQYCHADIFELYCTNSFVFAATDGGVFRLSRNNDQWTALSRNMQIAQSYRLAVDPSASAGFVLMGNQDCGTYRNTGSAYTVIGGGDGMESLVRPSNSSVIYFSSQNGAIRRSDNSGGSSTPLFGTATANGICGCTESAAWTTPMRLRPGNDQHIYVGYRSIWFSTNQGASGWTRITPTFANPIISMEFAPSNSTVLYATDGAVVARYNLSSGTWSRNTIQGDLPASMNITWLTVDPDDANHVIVTIGGFTATRKVFETFNANDGNPTWNNITRNLPNVPINTVAISNDAINTMYIGTDIGVFVTSNNRVNWLMYSNGLPATRVYDLEINTAINPARIYAATFGRGVFSAETYTGCIQNTVLAGQVEGLHYTEVSNSIISTQLVGGGTGTSIGYNSGGSIELKPGFIASEGSKFEAYIQGCSNSTKVPKPLSLLPQPQAPIPKKE